MQRLICHKTQQTNQTNQMFVPYQGHTLVGSYPSEEVQSVYSTPSSDWGFYFEEIHSYFRYKKCLCRNQSMVIIVAIISTYTIPHYLFYFQNYLYWRYMNTFNRIMPFMERSLCMRNGGSNFFMGDMVSFYVSSNA